MKKKSILPKILIVVVVLVIIFVVAVATRPAAFTITRAAVISAPPEVVFAQVNDFRAWDAWSPWARLDPGMKTTFSGADSGEGAVYEWAGNSDVGEGRMTLETSRPGELIRIKLEFLKPMTAVNVTDFEFEPAKGATQVTWTMSGTNNFAGKAFSLFVDMDQLVGGDFEKGLAQLKSVAEAKAKEPGTSAPAEAP